MTPQDVAERRRRLVVALELEAVPRTRRKGRRSVISNQPPGERTPQRTTLSTRYGLFGHDLEKGVVLRARLRAVWIRSQTPDVDARALFEEFLREPPPLGP